MRARTSPGTAAAAQLRLLHALVAGLDPPLLGAARRAALGEPRAEESMVGGVPSTVFRPPKGRGPWPAVLVYSGATRRGRMHPAFQGLGRALAAAGQLVTVAEPSGVNLGELRLATLDDALAAARALAESPEARDGRVALAGVSVGAMLALLAAADPGLRDRVTVVAALAPCCDVALALRVVTTDTYLSPAGPVPFVPGGFSRLVIARSLAASLPESVAREELRRVLLGLPDDAPDPLAPLFELEAFAEVRDAVALLLNRDPARFEELYELLPGSLREAIARVSPISNATSVQAPVEIVVGREDKYIPLVDAERYAAACPSARLTILESLAHAVPRASLRDARDLARLDGALVRVLAASRRRP